MRVAIVMAGHLRGLDALVEQQMHILNRCGHSNEVDLFIQTWGGASDNGDDERKLAELVNLLRPTAVRFSPLSLSQADGQLLPGFAGAERDEQIAERFGSMWTGIAEGYEMVTQHESATGTAFDVVIRTRPDVLWNMEYELSQLQNSARFPRRHGADMEPSDLAFVVRRHDAEKIFTFRSRLAEVAVPYQTHGYPTLVPEYALGYYLGVINLEWEAFGSDVVLMRENGDELWFDHDDESFAFKSGKGIHASIGDGLRYGQGSLTSQERVARDIAVNCRAINPADFAVAADGLRLLALSYEQPRSALRATLRKAEPDSAGLILVYLASVLALILKLVPQASRYKDGFVIVAILSKSPLRSIRLFSTLARLAQERVRRRKRTAEALDMSKRPRGPRSHLS